MHSARLFIGATLVPVLVCVSCVQPLAAQPVVEMPEITVWATRDPLPLQARSAGVTIVTGDELRATGAATLNRALGLRLGLPNRNDLRNSGNDVLDLRGFGASANDNLVVMVDGVRLNNADQTAPALNLISLDVIEQVEVRRGNQAVLFGEGATGGAIVITTRRQVDPGSSGRVGFGVGNLKQRQFEGQLGHSVGPWTLQTAWARRLADNHRDNSASALTQASASLGWQQEGASARVRAEHGTVDSRFPGSLTDQAYAVNPQQSRTPNDWGRSAVDTLTVDASLQLGDWRLVTALADSERLAQSFFGSGPLGEFELTAQQLDLQAEHVIEGVRFRHQSTFGLVQQRWRRDDIRSSFGQLTRMRSTSTDWYVRHLVTQLDSGIAFGAGYRQSELNRSRRNIDGTSPSAISESPSAWDLTLALPVTAGVLQSSLGRSYRAANLDELAPGFGNFPLRVQYSKDTELAWLWAVADWSGELRFYRHDLVDELGFDGSLGSFGLNTNLDPTRRQGIEAELAYGLSPALRLIATLREGRAKFRSGANAGRDIPLAFTDSMQLRFDWQEGQQQASIAVRHVRGAAVDVANRCSTPNYTVVSASYTRGFGPWSLSVSGDNLTNERFYNTAFSCSGSSPTSLYPEPGRRLLLNLSYVF